METFSFTIFVEEDISTEQANSLFKLAPDATAGVSCGKSYIAFDRVASFEETTINGALDQVRCIGLTPVNVRKDWV